MIFYCRLTRYLQTLPNQVVEMSQCERKISMRQAQSCCVPSSTSLFPRRVIDHLEDNSWFFKTPCTTHLSKSDPDFSPESWGMERGTVKLHLWTELINACLRDVQSVQYTTLGTLSKQSNRFKRLSGDEMTTTGEIQERGDEANTQQNPGGKPSDKYISRSHTRLKVCIRRAQDNRERRHKRCTNLPELD